MSDTQCFKLIEAIFEEKFRLEQIEYKNHVILQSGLHGSFFKFVYDFFVMKFGLK